MAYGVYFVHRAVSLIWIWLIPDPHKKESNGVNIQLIGEYFIIFLYNFKQPDGRGKSYSPFVQGFHSLYQRKMS